MAVKVEGAVVSDEPSVETRQSARDLVTVTDILSALSVIQSDEAAISLSLSDTLSSQEPIFISLERLQSLAPRVEEISLDASLLSNKVSATAGTAQRVGDRVRLLDEELRRIRESIERVGQVSELKSSLQLLESSMQSKDYDAASRHCARAMAIPREIVNSRFAEAVIVSYLVCILVHPMIHTFYSRPPNSRHLQLKRFKRLATNYFLYLSASSRRRVSRKTREKQLGSSCFSLLLAGKPRALRFTLILLLTLYVLDRLLP